MTHSPRTVLITGTSSGIGRATAELLAGRGYRVLAGARTSGDAATPAIPGTEPVQLDVTDAAHVAAVVQHIHAECPDGLYALINNAGLAAPSPVELVDLDEVRQLMEVNVLGPLRLIQECLPLLRKARGRVINISSMNGTLSLPMVGAYSASKFALEALSDALRVELRPWGIPISVIRPGQVQTDIFAKALAALAERSAQIPAELVPGYRKLFARATLFSQRGAKKSTRPQAVARMVLKALEARRPKPRYWVGHDVKGLNLLQSLAPTRLLDRILARAMGTMRLEKVRSDDEPTTPPPEGLRQLRPGTLRNS